jgi:hypothetical protein
VDFMGGHLLAGPDGTDKARDWNPWTFFSANRETAAAAAIDARAASAAKNARNGCSKTTYGTGYGRQDEQRRALGLGGDQLGPGPIKPSAPAPGPSPSGIPHAPSISTNPAPAPASAGSSSRFSGLDYLNSTGEGNPALGDLDSAPDWGSGGWQNQVSDETEPWGGDRCPRQGFAHGFARRSKQCLVRRREEQRVTEPALCCAATHGGFGDGVGGGRFGGALPGVRRRRTEYHER